MTIGKRHSSADVTAAGTGSVPALPDLRDDDLAALAKARAMEAVTPTVSVRINARTVISTTPENAERLRRLYADMLANPT